MKVYVTRRLHVKKRYHTNEDCPNMAERYREVDKEAIDSIYDECKCCDDDVDVRERQDQTAFECPYCEKEVGKLPVHLPRCEKA